MAGFREFAAGEPLTATNVDDFLMKQSVMKFADGAARDLALGTAVVSPNALREGMIAYLDDTDDVLKYDGSAWVTVGAAGIGSNVVQAVKTDTFSTSSATFGDVTGLSVTITPSTDTSKILLIAKVAASAASGNGAGLFVLLVGGNLDYKGVAASLRTRATSQIGRREGTVFQTDFGSFDAGAVVVDSPATASAVTYKIQARANYAGGGGFINQMGSDTDDETRGRLVSSLVAIEVAA